MKLSMTQMQNRVDPQTRRWSRRAWLRLAGLGSLTGGVALVSQGSAAESGIFDPDLAHMAVLSLARSGATGQAIDLFYKFKPRLPETEKILSLHARLFKDEYLNSQTQDRQYKLGLKARDLYLRAYDIHHNYYPAIDAATLSFLVEDNEAAKDLAEEVIRICERTSLSGTEDDYYLHVTPDDDCSILQSRPEMRAMLDGLLRAHSIFTTPSALTLTSYSSSSISS